MKKITLALLMATLSFNAQVLSEDFSAGSISGSSTFPNGWTTIIEDGSSGNWEVGILLILEIPLMVEILE